MQASDNCLKTPESGKIENSQKRSGHCDIRSPSMGSTTNEFSSFSELAVPFWVS